MNLNHVTISVTNVERSISFYQKLGLRLIVKALPRYARFECTAGDGTFSLHQSDLHMHPNGASIYFELENLDEHVTALIEDGMEFDELPADRQWLWR